MRPASTSTVGSATGSTGSDGRGPGCSPSGGTGAATVAGGAGVASDTGRRFGPALRAGGRCLVRLRHADGYRPAGFTG